MDAYGDDVGYVEQVDEGVGGKGGVGGILIMTLGCLLFPFALACLAWNEWSSVCTNHMLIEAEDNAVVAECGSPGGVEGKFTFFSCPVEQTSFEKMSPQSSFNTPGLKELIHFNSIAGSQKIEMYQCIETKEEETVEGDTPTSDSILEMGEDDGHDQRKGRKQRQASLSVRSEAERRRRTVKADPKDIYVYKYNMAWSATYYDSHMFKGNPDSIASAGCSDFVYDGQVNHNPVPPDRGDGTECELGRQTVHATNIGAGGFTFGDAEELKKLEATQQVELSPFASDFSLDPGTNNIVTALSPTTMGHHAGQQNYLSSCNEDRLGCVRISWNQSNTSHISVLGMTGGSGVIEPMHLPSKWGCGEQNYIKMYPREMTKEEMISELKGNNELKCWIYRVGGLLCAWLALFMCFQPISNASTASALSLIPFFGPLMESAFEGMVDMFLCLVSCSIGLSCGLLMIGVVWCGMRPIVGGPLVGACVVLLAIGYVAGTKAHRDPRRMRKGKMAVQEPYGDQAPLMSGEEQ